MGRKQGAVTSLSDCQKCHVSVTIARQQSAQRPWATRDRFPHDESHRPRGCPDCHLKQGAPDLVPPTMTLCAEQCHDGKKAFKVTGFGCFRCHGAKS
jgi:hypothetical protein